MERWCRRVLAGVLGVVASGCGSEPATTPGADGSEPASPAAALGRSDEGSGEGIARRPGASAEPSERCPEPRVPLARRIGDELSEACKAAAVDPMQVDARLDLSLTGAWKGEYSSESLGSSPTRFDASLFVTGGVLGGTLTEPNTFGPVGYAELQADLTGDAYATRQVVLLKTYRTATVDHSVLYVGRLDDAGTRIEGHWRLGGMQGTFWMEKG
jgi:hypothetical protein